VDDLTAADVSETQDDAALMEFIKKAAAGEDVAADETEELREKLKEAAEREMAARVRQHPATAVYQNSSEKAEDNRSSAGALMVTGGLGLILLVLFFFDVLPYQVTGFGKYILTVVMGALFVVFLVMGALALKKSRALEAQAAEEDSQTEAIKEWCQQNLRAAELDAEVFAAEEVALDDEVKYFRRAERISELINGQFADLKEGYLERLIDEVYEDMYGDGDVQPD
jgi:hypothetical protein